MKNFMMNNFDVRSVVYATYVGPGCGSSVHKNRLSHGLAVQLTSPTTYTFDTGKKITIDKNEIIYLPKGSNYVALPKNSDTPVKSSCYAINFQLDEGVGFEPFKLMTKNSGAFIDCFKRAETAWQQRMHNYEMKCKSELYDILFMMQQEYRMTYSESRKKEIIRPGVLYIHQNYTSEIISVEKLAELCGITSVYFRKLFRQFYGTSPIKYINNLKITRARELIESGLHPVNEAATLSGFSDISYFSREFKKATERLPSELKG